MQHIVSKQWKVIRLNVGVMLQRWTVSLPWPCSPPSHWQWRGHCEDTSRCPALGPCDHILSGRPCLCGQSGRKTEDSCVTKRLKTASRSRAIKLGEIWDMKMTNTQGWHDMSVLFMSIMFNPVQIHNNSSLSWQQQASLMKKLFFFFSNKTLNLRTFDPLVNS